MSEKLWVGVLAHKAPNLEQNLHNIALLYVGIDPDDLTPEHRAAYCDELEKPVAVISNPDNREAAKMFRVMAFMNYMSKEDLVTKHKYKLEDLVKVYASTEVIEPYWVKHYMHYLPKPSQECMEKWMKVKEKEVTREELNDFLRSLVSDMGVNIGYNPLKFIYFHLMLWACGITLFFPYWTDADRVVNMVNAYLGFYDDDTDEEC